MNKEVARFLLESLIERIDRDAIGTVSSGEREALGVALSMLVGGSVETVSVPSASSPSGESPASDGRSEVPVAGSNGDEIRRPTLSLPPRPVKLVLDALDRDRPDNPTVLLCLDFGTAMSKAFAMAQDGTSFDLELGTEAGGEGFAIPSSVFITDAGKVLFGFEALEASQELVESNRQRLDSIKGSLSLRSQGDLDSEACLLRPEMNPTEVRLTEGDLIRIFLAYLTDLAVSQLQSCSVSDGLVSRYVSRRFAHPCWPSAAQKTWADRLMRSWMAEAQILADTFHGKWDGGLDVAELKSAIDQVRALERRPEYLIDAGVPEPVAVAAGVLADGSDKREPFMVVDVGAGTTDFGLFILREDEEKETSKVFQVPGSIKALMQAGDKIDGMLKKFILEAQAVDMSDPHGRLIGADLSRRIRGLKERLFADGEVQYVLADSTLGRIELEDFLGSRPVKEFAERVDRGFREVLEAVDDTYLNLLSLANLKVVLTGGGAQLPMMRALAEGWVEVKGKRIARQLINPLPVWIAEQAPELEPIYPQLAVAIGGAAAELPETLQGPQVFGGGGGRHAYTPGRMQLSGV